MPKYSYACPACRWSGDLMSTIAERDEQSCAQLVDPCTRERCGAPCEDHCLCGSNLKREEITLTARMSEAWKV